MGEKRIRRSKELKFKVALEAIRVSCRNRDLIHQTLHEAAISSDGSSSMGGS
jgi:hypothetical protein